MVETSSQSNVDNTTSDRSGLDITDEVEIDSDDVKIYKIRELAPKSAPITIPYMEIYRTNELEFIPYISPYNVGCSSSSDGSDVDSSSSSNDSSSSLDTGSSDTTNSSENTGDSSSSD